jgi:peptidoglycan/xylan/chitin deacetylase (PgdA/CDA1 family)
MGRPTRPAGNLFMRFDRQLTTAVFHPLQRAGFGAPGAGLPILMYHGLCADPEEGVAAYYKTNTEPSVFRRQMRDLASQGYKTVDLSQAVEWLKGGRPPGSKTFVITFDDGFRDFLTHGFPALQAHGFTAAMFLPAAFVGDQTSSFKGKETLTWQEAREMRRAGITFGSHTVNHPELVRLSPPDIDRELRDSRARIEQQLGEPVTTFAYPYAFPQGNRPFAKMFRDLLIEAGYACCVTTELGRVKAGDDPYRMKRLPVNSLDDEALLRAKLEGGYDWLALPQRAFKRLKASLRPASCANSRAEAIFPAGAGEGTCP